MTFKDKAIEMMTERGLDTSEAESVFELIKADPANAAMANRWNDDVSNYPAQALAILRVSVKHTALIWIDENCPRAWFRPMFTPDPEAEMARLEKASSND